MKAYLFGNLSYSWYDAALVFTKVHFPSIIVHFNYTIFKITWKIVMFCLNCLKVKLKLVFWTVKSQYSEFAGMFFLIHCIQSYFVK